MIVCAMGRAVGLVLASLALLPLSQARANPVIEETLRQMAGTLNVSFEPVMTNGRVSSCTLVFNVLHQDWTYRQGRYIKVSGNFGLMSAQKKMASSLKVVVVEVDPNTYSLAPTSTPATRAYLVANDFSTNLDSVIAARLRTC